MRNQKRGNGWININLRQKVIRLVTFFCRVTVTADLKCQITIFASSTMIASLRDVKLKRRKQNEKSEERKWMD